MTTLCPPSEYILLLHNPRAGIWRTEGRYRRLISFLGKLTNRSMGRDLGWESQSTVTASVNFGEVEDIDQPSSMIVSKMRAVASWGEYEQIELRFVVNVGREVIDLAERFGLYRGFLELRLEPIRNSELVATKYWSSEWDPERWDSPFVRFKSLNFLPDSPHVTDA